MKITYQNKNVIEENISIHDALFEGFTYNYDNKCIHLCVNEYHNGIKFNMNFVNVYGMEMFSYDAWGPGYNIMEWILVDSSEDRFMRCLLSSSEAYSFTRLISKDKLLGTSFTLNSGDTLTIVCEYIEFSEEVLSEEEVKEYMGRFKY